MGCQLAVANVLAGKQRATSGITIHHVRKNMHPPLIIGTLSHQGLLGETGAKDIVMLGSEKFSGPLHSIYAL